MENRADRLKVLVLQFGGNNLKRKDEPKANLSLEDALGLLVNNTTNGDVYYLEKTYPLQYQHGSVNFSEDIDFARINQWGHITENHSIGKNSYVFLDCETTGLVGGTGTFPFLIGLGWWKDDVFHLFQLFLSDPSRELAFLTGLDELLSPFHIVVTFNGKSFDIPLLRTRQILNSIGDLFSDWDHLDLLHLSRRIWRDRLPSRALADLEKEILKLEREEQDIPGWMIPEMYLDYLRSHDPEPLKGIFYHNQMDILSLAALFLKTAKMLENPLSTIDESLDTAAVARLFEEMNLVDLALELYESCINRGLPIPFYVNIAKRYAVLFRRQGRWEQAERIWKSAAQYLDQDSCIELAKYYEHQKREYSSALIWTLNAMKMDGNVPKDDIEKRRVRLLKRMSIDDG